MGCTSSIKIKSKNVPTEPPKDDTGRSKTPFSTEVVHDLTSINVEQKETVEPDAQTVLEVERIQESKAGSQEEMEDLPGIPASTDTDNHKQEGS
ncbi:hypothetical protein MATL_G00160030 [Megalops atlanticus]|uniref:Uncharacterized protein n=1 Tax=Megalops atlanticus TaxID=7932 RepID=A0A9D3PT24_MEGAT|nr:hypothetical protein MATL_G00160030 [Megalops atlanticus]